MSVLNKILNKILMLWLIIKSIAITLHTCIVIIIVECFAVPARGGSYSGPADPLPHHTCQDKGEIREGECLKWKQISIFYWLPLAQCLCISRHLGQVRGHWSATTRRMRTWTCPGLMWRSKGWTPTSRGSRWWPPFNCWTFQLCVWLLSYKLLLTGNSINQCISQSPNFVIMMSKTIWSDVIYNL